MTAQQQTTGKQREPYVIKADPVPERYARGWYVIGSAGSVSHKPKQLDVFGTRLVAYRGKDDDQVHVLDAYCPHMGGDLCGGEVKGNSILCPFHLWSWGADGVCVTGNEVGLGRVMIGPCGPCASGCPEGICLAWMMFGSSPLLGCCCCVGFPTTMSLP